MQTTAESIETKQVRPMPEDERCAMLSEARDKREIPQCKQAEQTRNQTTHEVLVARMFPIIPLGGSMGANLFTEALWSERPRHKHSGNNALTKKWVTKSLRARTRASHRKHCSNEHETTKSWSIESSNPKCKSCESTNETTVVDQHP